MPPSRTPPRLTVELVPETCWYSNVRSLVDKTGWDRIRRKVYRQCAYRCEICGGRGPQHPVEAHEIWAYDDTTHTQTLVGMIGLCPDCHQVKHIGLAGVHGHAAQAEAHLARVNGWTVAATRRHVSQAFQTWAERSRHRWTLDLSGLRPYVTAREYQAAVAAAEAERAKLNANGGNGDNLDAGDELEATETGGVVVVDLGPPDGEDLQPGPLAYAATTDAAAAGLPAQAPAITLSPSILGARGPMVLLGWTVAALVLVGLMLLVGWWVPFVLAAAALVVGILANF